MPANTFEIEEGEFALALVNTAAVGYLAAWNAPGGDDVETAVLADYTGAAAWYCQVTSGKLTPRANVSNRERKATFCGPAEQIPVVGVTSYTLDVAFYQDPHVSTGLAKFLFEHDTKEAYFLLGLNGGDPPRAIGRVRLTASDFGGDPDTDLEATLSLPLSRRPSISFGNATTSVIVSVANPLDVPVRGPVEEMIVIESSGSKAKRAKKQSAAAASG